MQKYMNLGREHSSDNVERKHRIDYDYVRDEYRIDGSVTGLVIGGIKSWAKEYGVSLEGKIVFADGIDPSVGHKIVERAYVDTGELVFNGLRYVDQKFECQRALVTELYGELARAGYLEQTLKADVNELQQVILDFTASEHSAEE